MKRFYSDPTTVPRLLIFLSVGAPICTAGILGVVFGNGPDRSLGLALLAFSCLPLGMAGWVLLWFRRQPVLCSDEGIGRAGNVLPWNRAKLTVTFRHEMYHRGIVPVLFVDDHHLSEYEIRSKSYRKRATYLVLTATRARSILSHDPGTIYFSVEPPPFYRAIVRMIDDHNRSVSEKQKEMNP